MEEWCKYGLLESLDFPNFHLPNLPYLLIPLSNRDYCRRLSPLTAKRFRPLAQGCPPQRTTLGTCRIWPHLPQRGYCFRRNPVGVKHAQSQSTQGSCATLGWRAQRPWRKNTDGKPNQCSCHGNRGDCFNSPQTSQQPPPKLLTEQGIEI